MHENYFTEKGAESLNLFVKSKNYQMRRIELGINFAKCFSTATESFIPEMGISWVRDPNGGKYYIAKLVDQTTYFTVYGVCDDLNLVVPILSLNYSKNQGASIFSLGCRGEFGRHWQENNFYLEFIFKF